MRGDLLDPLKGCIRGPSPSGGVVRLGGRSADFVVAFQKLVRRLHHALNSAHLIPGSVIGTALAARTAALTPTSTAAARATSTPAAAAASAAKAVADADPTIRRIAAVGQAGSGHEHPCTRQ